MLRRFLPFKLVGCSELQQKFGLSVKLRRYPVLLTCLSSGLLYRSVVTSHQPQIFWNSSVPVSFPFTEHTVLHSMTGGSDQQPDNKRIERMAALRCALEDELPRFFDQSLLAIPSELFDPETLVSYEGKNGRIHTTSNRSLLNTALVLVRAYYMTRSSFQRVEVLNILSDSEKWEVEVSFRVVLIPGPSLRDSRLPGDVLWRKLESEAQWHEFRATFLISEAAKVSEVRVTKFMPPQRPPETLQNLKQLGFLKRLSPVLPGRRLPSPTPFVSLSSLCVASLSSTLPMNSDLSSLFIGNPGLLDSWNLSFITEISNSLGVSNLNGDSPYFLSHLPNISHLQKTGNFQQPCDLKSPAGLSIHPSYNRSRLRVRSTSSVYHGHNPTQLALCTDKNALPVKHQSLTALSFLPPKHPSPEIDVNRMTSSRAFHFPKVVPCAAFP